MVEVWKNYFLEAHTHLPKAHAYYDFFFGPFRVLSPNETSAKKNSKLHLTALGFFPHFCQFGDSSALLYANSYVDYGIDLQRGHAMEYHPLG
jgi:hypothetical protein